MTDDGSGVAACVVEKLASAGIRAVRAAEVPTDARGVLFLGGLGSADSAQKALGVQRAAWRTARSIGAKCGETGGVFVTVQDTGGDFG
ncbi:hypothetical protein, partial [Streptomyces sp. NRRL S-15]|uniref:hypothetical protein n=1 Tax=Streptomyces sp. NRRL S-15 TaxID=1463886 RepID=UPI00131E344B